MKKLLIIIVVCMCVLGTVFFAACNEKPTPTPENDTALTLAISQLKSASSYTITTIVESQTTGVRSEKEEVITISGDTVTVVTTNKKPNEIGADEAVTTTTEEATYSKDAFVGIVFNVQGLSYTVNGDTLEIQLTSSAEVESVFGLKDVAAANATVKLNNNAFDSLTYSYITNNQNKVTVTIK